MRFRGKSIRRKIVGLLLVPLVSLTSIWAFATVITGREAQHLLAAAEVVGQVGVPAEDTVQALQQERRRSLVFLADPRDDGALARLHSQERLTDKVVERFRRNAENEDVRDDLGHGASAALDEVLRGLNDLADLRRKVEERAVTRSYAFSAYNVLVDPGYEFLGALHAVNDTELDKQGRALVGVAQAREVLAREDALMASGLAAQSLDQRELRQMSDLMSSRKLLYDTNLPLLPSQERMAFEDFWNGPITANMRSVEERVIAAGFEGVPAEVTADRWESAASKVLDELAELNAREGRAYQDRVEPAGFTVLAQAGVSAILGFAAVVASLVVSVRIGSSLIRDLMRLRKDAQEVSGIRLPSVMRRLAAGESVDVEAETPQRKHGEDEAGQVASAFDTVHRVAVESAVKQAELRRGVSEVFVNLARRSQVLLHRQLNLLDAMERRTEDSEELADLFRLDHLTTRMRRHAEGLVILSGAAPSRQWRKPVRLMDVVRAAAAEVEDYERIDVRRLPKVSVVGPAVGDLTHLLAELLENASVFSPPHSSVQVVGERAAKGFTLEIHDRGLGMAPDTLQDANLRLAETPEFELSDTDRLGLFVVSRLARRQGVRVSLQASPYGGTTAVVFIPAAVLIEPSDGGTTGGGDESERTAGRGVPRSGPAAKERTPAPLAEVRRPTSVPAGPAERETPVRSAPSRLDERRGPVRRPVEEHQQARETDGAEVRAEGLMPLPRRRSPVLVSDHGRPVEGRRRPEPAESIRPADAETIREAEGTVTVTDPAEDAEAQLSGLPRRVRQASIAPQLKDDPAPEAGQDPESAGSAPERDADLVKSRMASLQRGWQRGRADTGTEGTPEDAGSAGDTARGTTPEGDGR
ncbi:nitrate- and nitrite sensing domain-containing protein [Streptomyces pathocidini]|uniref:histidine kinase n=1 Tax=Streptomyces pathocidini TaxID=1650571 RepID=A0ABW7UR20_9ACTN|nr:ATP-binding protein [Streptomyces pathocidini]